VLVNKIEETQNNIQKEKGYAKVVRDRSVRQEADW
jgi:hypothetical protein